MFLGSFPVGFLSDRLLNTERLSSATIRKIFNSMGSLGPAVGMIWLAFVGCDGTMAIVALVLSAGLSSGSYAGYNVRCDVQRDQLRVSFVLSLSMMQNTPNPVPHPVPPKFVFQFMDKFRDIPELVHVQFHHQILGIFGAAV
jgi:hypothetical protein